MTFRSGFAAIIGRPNVGKSTLLNSLLGERLAAVTKKPQTTRHKISGIYNSDDAQIVFLDTPGYHHSRKPLNRVMNEIVDSVAQDADVVLIMVEANKQGGDIERKLFDRIGADRCIVVANKSDLVNPTHFEDLSAHFRDEWKAKEMVFISALTGEGVVALIKAIKERLPEGEPFYPTDIYTSHPVRFIAAEIIREEVFLQMQQEIPYSAAVEIEEFKDPKKEGDITCIRAAIVVERETQKGMVVGKRGARIKEIGTKARKKIEDLVGGKVFLELRVRVEKDWTKDEDSIHKLGYSTQIE
jgi:GTP-binding protein Era